MSQVSYTTLPSSLAYSLNVPEVQNLTTKFVYNFFVVDETINDSGKISKDVAEVSHIMIKAQQNGSIDYLTTNDKSRTPRYVKLSFCSPPLVVKGELSNDLKDANVLLKQIVHEEDFHSQYFTTLNIDNKTIESQIPTVFDSSFEKTISTLTSSFDNVNNDVSNALLLATSLNSQTKGLNFAQSLVSKNFADLKKVKFTGQISNNVIYDLFLFSSSSYGTNGQFFAKNLEFAKSQFDKNKNDKFSLNDSQFKPTIKVYLNGSDANSISNTTNIFKTVLKGYLIEKAELLSDDSVKIHNPIVLPKGSTASYVDYKVRYGAIYAYQVRAIYEIRYNAVDSETLTFKNVTSLVSSRPEMSYVETIEEIAPPPPAELRFIWDYDRFNPTTATFDPSTGKPFPGTGTRGSLLICWSFPNNPQMDIKKFQVFRRKTVDEPFELLKMIDFDDSFAADVNSEFFSRENLIDQRLIERSVISRDNLPTISVPIQIYYDDDFIKSSEYIYAVASVDAHGLSSNYSQQFKVSFDQFNNKVVKSLVSIDGAPKPYPNMYLQQDLFVDIIKSGNKKNLRVYLTPDCYHVQKGNGGKVDILNSEKAGAEYMINFINTDNATGTSININIDGNNVA